MWKKISEVIDSLLKRDRLRLFLLIFCQKIEFCFKTIFFIKNETGVKLFQEFKKETSARNSLSLSILMCMSVCE